MDATTLKRIKICMVPSPCWSYSDSRRPRALGRTDRRVPHCIATTPASQASRLTWGAMASHTHSEFFGKFPDTTLESNERGPASNLCLHGSLLFVFGRPESCLNKALKVPFRGNNRPRSHRSKRKLTHF